jgi:hypothetical protein
MNNYIDLDDLQIRLSSRMPAIIITSLTLTAGLAWNDTIQSFINYYIPEDSKKEMNIWMKLIYVICLSIVIIIIIDFLVRIENNTKNIKVNNGDNMIIT